MSSHNARRMWRRRLSPHCPNCTDRMFRDGADYRCGKCGKRYGFRVTGKILGFNKSGLVALDNLP